MGKANQFEKRKARAQAAMVRTIEKRQPYDIVLVVCEGAKTEPNYLNSMKKDFGLNNANIRIVDESHGNDPKSVVEFAIHYYEADPIYDRIYCVFDKNGHNSYKPALDLASSHDLKKQKKLFVINSVPCFELWLLLHYTYTTKAYETVGTRSSCEQVIRDLKSHLTEYEKGHRGVYDSVKLMTDKAIKHSKQLEKNCKLVGSYNPYTRLHELVEYFKKLAKTKTST